LVGPPVLIDNTPPVVRASTPRRTGATLDIDIDAEDLASSLRRCEYSVDARPWQPVEAAGFGHGIVAAAAPWVAAGEPPRSEANPDKRAVPPYRLDRVIRAAWQITAGGREERR